MPGISGDTHLALWKRNYVRWGWKLFFEPSFLDFCRCRFFFRSLPYRLGLVGKGGAGKEVKRDHSQKQGLLGAMMARSFESELNKIRAGKSLGFGGSCLIAARK
jgi:hypothetical protein